MSSKITVIDEISAIKTLKQLTQVYGEVALMKMQKIRKKVLDNRTFILNLFSLYSEIQILYNRKSKIRTSSEQKNQALVYISLPRRFSGGIAQKVFKYFLKKAKKTKKDVFILGVEGKKLWKESVPNKTCNFLPLPSEGDFETVRDIIKKLKNYKNVEIVYGKFSSIVRQEPDAVSLFEEKLSEEKMIYSDIVDYLFEPNLEEVWTFIIDQVPAYNFAQLLYESRLAQLGSRTNAMHTASERIKTKDEKLKQILRTIEKREQNKKQQQRFAGMLLWQ